MASGDSTQSRVTPYLIYLVLITTLGPLQFGYHLAELNAPQAVLTCERKSIHSSAESLSHSLPRCIPMNPSQFGLVSSIYTLGGFLGALLAGPVSTKHGRLFALRATTIFFILGPIAETLASSISMLGFGRFLSGVGSGAAIVVGPIYVSEIAPPSARGFFGAFTQIMTNVGILLTQLIGYFLSEGSMWRIILAIAGTIGMLQLLGLFMVPESPTWLAEHQKTDMARQVLQRIRGKNTDIEEEIEGWRTFMDASGLGEEQSLLTSPSANIPPKQPPVTIVRAALDPKYRPAIIAVVGVMCVTVADYPTHHRSFVDALGIYFNQKVLSVIAVLLFVSSFAIGLGPVPFILASELVGPEAVGAAQSWALAANWTATFVVAQFFPILNDILGGRGKIYWVFAGMAAILGGFIYGWVPETRGKANVNEVWGREDQRRRD
ncbi:hypothetical protein EYZ11_003008 [Aspergillus tanneri]|uniref:Major facilitator superfamily (MFS) profile domain-containing protein n=1 Tax=Aspergillus tanneri TaxID=1220188 RepID=A0A4S3JRH7_9EURO|nr:hypothetical protein EYZ11_003008 [Aspergillus tanneri]